MFAVLNFTGMSTTGSIQTNLGGQRPRNDPAEKLDEARTRAGQGRRSRSDRASDRGEQRGCGPLERMQRGELVQSPTGRNVLHGAARRGCPLSATAAFILKVQDGVEISWLLIPLSVPFMWLLFPFNRRLHIYDHTVFVTYSLSFMMMLVIVGGRWCRSVRELASWLFFVPPITHVRQ